MLGPSVVLLYSLFNGDNFIPTILFLTELPKESSPLTNIGLTNLEICLSFLKIINSIVSAVDALIKVEISRILSTLLSSIDIIILL